jgi:hypothetical protein
MANRLTKAQRAFLISEADFDRDYQPRKHRSGDFYTFQQVRRYPINRVWSIVDDGGETDHLYASPGYHVVNHLGYVVTRKPWDENTLDALYHEA